MHVVKFFYIMISSWELPMLIGRVVNLKRNVKYCSENLLHKPIYINQFEELRREAIFL